MKNYSQLVISQLASYHIISMKIKFWEENYYFKEWNINTRMSYLLQELSPFFTSLLANHRSLLFDYCSWRQSAFLTKLVRATVAIWKFDVR